MLGAGSRRGKTAAAALRRQAVGGRDTAACCSFGVLTMKILATLPAIGRDLRLDLFRGVANWGIFLDHIPNNIVNWVTTRNYGFSDAADLFIFISGYTEVESTAPFGCVAGSGLPDTRTLSPCDPIFFYYTAILWTGLHGVLAAVRPDG